VTNFLLPNATNASVFLDVFSTLQYLGRVFAPYNMHGDLIESIRGRYGGGEYRLLIREGRTMVFSGHIALAEAPGSMRDVRF